MKTLFALATIILLLCTVGCLVYLICLGRKIYSVLLGYTFEFAEFSYGLANRILAWEKKSGYTYDNTKKTYKKR
jgi:hypothetical protein